MTLDISYELGVDLAANDADDQVARAFVDPRSIPTRFSLLKLMALSPAHYAHGCQLPQDDSLASRLGAFTTDRKEALRFGTAVHLMLLGEQAKVARFCGRRAGKAWDDFQRGAAEASAAVILNEKEHARATMVAAAIRGNARAMELLFDGTIVEQRIDWSWLGRAIRSTPDAVAPTRIVDLKTTQSAKPDVFVRQGLRLFYHAQSALYRTCFDEVFGTGALKECFIVAVEKSSPFPVTILRMTDEALDIGARLCRLWMEQLLGCELMNEWPSYSESDVAFDVPKLGGSFEIEIDGRMVEVD